MKKELTSGSISNREEAMKYIEDMKVETIYDKANKIVEYCVNSFGGVHKEDRQKLIDQIRSKKTREALIK